MTVPDLPMSTLGRPRRTGADLTLRVDWSQGTSRAVADTVLHEVRRRRAQGLSTWVEVAMGLGDRLLAGLGSSFLQAQPLTGVPCPPREAACGWRDDPWQLCRQLRLEGAGARVVTRPRWAG